MLYLGLSLRQDKWLSTSDTLKQPFINAERLMVDQHRSVAMGEQVNLPKQPQLSTESRKYGALWGWDYIYQICDSVYRGLLKTVSCRLLVTIVSSLLRGQILSLDASEDVYLQLDIWYSVDQSLSHSLRTLMIFLSGDSFGLCGCVERVSQHDSFIMKGRV